MTEYPVTVKIIKLHPQARLPVYASSGASGADLFALLKAQLSIMPGQRSLIPTGLLLEIPAGFEAQIRPRSGLALNNGITVLNSPGTIDSDYRGEIKIIVINHGEYVYNINNGDRVAQIIITPVVRACFIETDRLSKTTRYSEGFGSTGR